MIFPKKITNEVQKGHPLVLISDKEKKTSVTLSLLIDRPCVAGPVLQTAPWLIDSVVL